MLDVGSRLRLYVGASAGITEVSGNARLSLSGVYSTGEVSDWRRTFAGSTGISVSLTRKISLEASYRYLAIQETRFESRFLGGSSAGPLFTLEKMKAHCIEAGVRFTF